VNKNPRSIDEETKKWLLNAQEGRENKKH